MDEQTAPNLNQPVQSPQPLPKTEPKKTNLKKIFIILIAVLLFAAVAFAAFRFYNQRQMKARDSQRKSDLKVLESALEKFKAKTQDQKYYPVEPTQELLVKTGILKKIPQDPKNSLPYIYSYRATPPQCIRDCTGYILAACLENKNDPEGKDPQDQCETKSYVITK